MCAGFLARNSFGLVVRIVIDKILNTPIIVIVSILVTVALFARTLSLVLRSLDRMNRNNRN